MKKKILSLILCLVMILPSFVFVTSANETADIRDLADKGQDHFYIGESWAASSPKQNGAVANGEYTISENITLADCPTSAFSDAKIHLAQDYKALYIAIEVTEPGFNYSKSEYAFQINCPVSGGAADAASYISIPLKVNSSGVTLTEDVAYIDNNSGGKKIGVNVTSDTIVCGRYVKHDTATKKTTIEVAISFEGINEYLAFPNSKLILFSAALKTNDVYYYYRLNIDSATQAAIDATYPNRAEADITWVPHVIHREAAPEVAANYDFYTLDGASVKMLSANNFAIRFETVFKKAYLEKLQAENPGAEIYVGTMIIEKSYLKVLKNDFTKPAIEAYRVPIQITETYADINNPLRSDADTNTYSGTITTVLNGTTEYAAIGFVNIAGNYTYSPVYTSRSAAGVAGSAFRDVTTASCEGYTTPVMLKTSNTSTADIGAATHPAFSCYSDAELLGFYQMTKNVSYTVLCHFWDVQPKVEGTVRLVSSNIYFHNLNWHHAGETEAQKKAIIKQNADFFAESQGDVILMQEVANGTLSGSRDYRVQDRLYPMLEAIGYKEAKATVGAFPKGTSSANFKGVNYTPVWYNPDVLTLEACEHVFYDSVGTNPDGGLSSSKSFTWALFTIKATGKQFIAASTHLTYHGDAEIANMLRKKDAEQLVKRLGEVSAQYSAPVLVGGDFNCLASSAPYATINAKFENVKTSAKILLNANYATMHEYPSTKLPAYKGSQIDFIFATRDAFDIALYQTMLSYKSLVAADHVPTSIDFNVK